MPYKFNPFTSNFDIVNTSGAANPGGSDTQVQFNDGGVFGGDSTFTFNKTTDTLTVANFATTGNVTLGDASGDTVAIQAGTAALPTLIPNGDPNTGLWFPAADTIAASTAGSERLRLDSSGNVGIGTAGAANGAGTRLEIKASNTIVDARGLLAINTTNAAAANLGGSLSLGGENGQAGTPYAFGSISGRYEGSGYAGYLQLCTTANNGVIRQRLKIDSVGTLTLNQSNSDNTSVSFNTTVQNALTLDSSGNLISYTPTTAPSLGVNNTMVFNLTSNTNLRVSVRGSDGVTRTANITLA